MPTSGHARLTPIHTMQTTPTAPGRSSGKWPPGKMRAQVTHTPSARIAQPDHERPQVRPSQYDELVDAQGGERHESSLERQIALLLVRPAAQTSQGQRDQEDQIIGHEGRSPDFPGEGCHIGIALQGEGLVEGFQTMCALNGRP